MLDTRNVGMGERGPGPGVPDGTAEGHGGGGRTSICSYPLLALRPQAQHLAQDPGGGAHVALLSGAHFRWVKNAKRNALCKREPATSPSRPALGSTYEGRNTARKRKAWRFPSQE